MLIIWTGYWCLFNLNLYLKAFSVLFQAVSYSKTMRFIKETSAF